MDIASLRDFVRGVDAGSISRAAAATGLSQPAMSQRITQLEADVGRRLLERGPRGVEPTAAGLELYRGARQVVREVDLLAERVGSGVGGIRGAVSVGLPATVAPLLVPELLTLVGERHPGVRLELFESMSGYIEELLGRGRLDLAVLFRDDADGGAPAGEVALYEEELFVVSAATLDADSSPVRATDLAARPLVERAFAEDGVAPHVVADVESLPAMVRVAQGGGASAVLPRSAVEPTAPDLVLRPLAPPLRRTVAVSVTPEFYEPRAAVLAVRDAVVDATRALVARAAWPGARLVPHRTPPEEQTAP